MHNEETTQSGNLTAIVIGRQDQVMENLNTAAAIIDCIRILSALERMPSPPASHDNGAGYAIGHKARDESMPLALHHALTLIEAARDTTEEISKLAIRAVSAIR